METFPEWKRRRRAEIAAVSAFILVPVIALGAYICGVDRGITVGVKAGVEAGESQLPACVRLPKDCTAWVSCSKDTMVRVDGGNL